MICSACRRLSTDWVIAKVAAAFRVDASAILQRGGGRIVGQARNFVVVLLRECGLSRKGIGRLLSNRDQSCFGYSEGQVVRACAASQPLMHGYLELRRSIVPRGVCCCAIGGAPFDLVREVEELRRAAAKNSVHRVADDAGEHHISRLDEAIERECAPPWIRHPQPTA